ncbi:MAG: hypothetical protein B7Z16_02735, partial [Algoriphagus sp. 32-45-6]
MGKGRQKNRETGSRLENWKIRRLKICKAASVIVAIFTSTSLGVRRYSIKREDEKAVQPLFHPPLTIGLISVAERSRGQ